MKAGHQCRGSVTLKLLRTAVLVCGAGATWRKCLYQSIPVYLRSDMSLPEKSTKSLSACRCLLLGEPLSGVVQTVGQLWRMSLQTLDAHGNVRAHGGEDITVEVEVSHP